MSRVEEIVEYLKEQGLERKYDAPGLYCIKINNKIVYVGKSLNMLNRIANHLFRIEQPQNTHKYQILAQAHRVGCTIGFDVIYKCQKQEEEEIIQDIGEEEGRVIRKLRPCLNYQIPKEGDYKHWTTNKMAKYITLQEILASK